LSRVPQAPADRNHPSHLHARRRGSDDTGHAGHHYRPEDAEGRDGIGRGGLAEGRRPKVQDGLRLGPPMSAAARRRWRRNLTGYAFAGPALIVLASFLLYPIAYSISLSLHEWDGYTPRWGSFVGFENYLALAADEVFWRATWNSVVFV